jgi:hypothetical protein
LDLTKEEYLKGASLNHVISKYVGTMAEVMNILGIKI